MSFKTTKKRAEQAFARDANWLSLLQDAYEYFLPQRDVFNLTSIGQVKDENIFDSTANRAIKQFANKIQEQITPIWRRWAELDLTDEIKRQIKGDEDLEKQAKEHLSGVTAIVFDHINRSNFATQINEAYLDLGIGTCALTIEETDNEDELIEFSAVPQNTVAFGKSARNKVENVYRKITIPIASVDSALPGYILSSSWQSKLAKNPDAEITITIALENVNGEFIGTAWDSNEKAWEENYGESSPWVIARWAVAAGEMRGRGPALDVLKDVKTLNKVEEFMLRKASLDLGGMFTGVDDGGFNPYNVKIAPGVIIPVSSNNNQDPSLRRLDVGGDLNLSMFEVQRLQTAIKESLFNDLRDPSSPVRSATEIAIEARELAMRIGSAFGRLQSELLVPILNRVMAILSRRGKIPPYKIGGQEVGVKFTSPLARLQDQEDLLALQESMAFVGQISPEMMQLGYKVEDLPKWLQERNGHDPALLRTQAEMQEGADKAVAQAQAEQMQGEVSEPIQ